MSTTFAPILSTDAERKLASMLREDATTCPRCGEENLTDTAVCAACRPLAHFTHRPCYCNGCEAERAAVAVSTAPGTLTIKKAA